MTAVPALSLPRELIRLGARPADKQAAIAEAAQLLLAGGCAEAGYGESMLKREAVANTFLGAGVAIPHGTVEDRHLVRRDGIAVLQIPEGLEWNPGQRVRLVVGIAARSDGHIAILRRLTRLIQDEALLERLGTTQDAEEIARALLGEAPAAPPAAEDLPVALEWIVSYPSGLHARPASAWVEAARAAGVPLRIRRGSESADPRQLVGLLQLG